MQAISYLFFVFITLTCFAQEEVTFNVVKNKNVYIECKFDTLVGNTFYYFKAYGVSTKDIIPGKFSGGEVWLNDTAVSIHTSGNTSSTKKYLLELYLKKNNREILSRNFTIIPATKAPEFNPVVFNRRSAILDIGFQDMLVSFARMNDTISKDSVLKHIRRLFTAFIPSSRSNSRVLITLSITINCGGVAENYPMKSLQLTQELQNKLQTLSSGCVVLINGINFHSMHDPPDDVNAGPFKIVVKE